MHLRKRARSRRAAIYIVVLMASLIVAAMALSSIETARWLARGRSDAALTLRLRMTAEAGLEYALAQIAADVDWRTNLQHNQDTAPLDLNGVTVVYRLRDQNDGNLANKPLDPATIIVTASIGESRYAIQASLVPDGDALECLNYSVVAAKDIDVQDFSRVASDQVIASNRDISTQDDGHLTGTLLVGRNTSGNLYGSSSSLDSDLVLPDSSLLDYYQSQGTEIPLANLPLIGGRYTIRNSLLSAAANPFSSTLNERGIYFIDCNDQVLSIQDSRLCCTLVLINPHQSSQVTGSVCWNAAVPNYPILLVDGGMQFNLTSIPLTEATTSTNFNPFGTPYRGRSDSDLATVYPSRLSGLIYLSRDLELASLGGKNEIAGCLLVNRDIVTEGDLSISYRDIFARNPPPGFQESSRMRIVSGSVQRCPVP